MNSPLFHPADHSDSAGSTLGPNQSKKQTTSDDCRERIVNSFTRSLKLHRKPKQKRKKWRKIQPASNNFKNNQIDFKKYTSTGIHKPKIFQKTTTSIRNKFPLVSITSNHKLIPVPRTISIFSQKGNKNANLLKFLERLNITSTVKGWVAPVLAPADATSGIKVLLNEVTAFLQMVDSFDTVAPSELFPQYLGLFNIDPLLSYNVFPHL